MEIFIVGAGESLRDFDYSRLVDKRTVVVNKAIQDLPSATYWLTADSGIASNVQDWTRDSDAIKVLAYSPTHKRIDKFQKVFTDFDVVIKYSGGNPCPDIGFKFGEFQSGGNSGFCALQFAVIMRYSPIYLLGIDLAGGHLYDAKRPSWTKLLSEFYESWKKALKILKETDIEVYSCSPTSRLNDVIPYKKIGDVT